MGVATKLVAVGAGAALIAGGVAMFALASEPPNRPSSRWSRNRATPRSWWTSRRGSTRPVKCRDSPVRRRSTPSPPRDLTADSFSLYDGATALDIDVTTVAKLSDTSYRLTLDAGDSGRTVTPNRTRVVIPGHGVRGPRGGRRTDRHRAVPRDPADGVDAKARFGGPVARRPLELRAFGPLPFVGSWFVNEQVRTRSTDYSDAANQHVRELAGPHPVDAAIEFVSAPRGPSATSSRGSPPPWPVSGHRRHAGRRRRGPRPPWPASSAVSFTHEAAVLTLDPSVAAASRSIRQVTDVTALPFSLDATAAFDLHLGGSLTLDLTTLGSSGAAPLADYDLRMDPRSISLTTEGARIGMVSVTPTLSVQADALQARLRCEDGCESRHRPPPAPRR
jgi:hypothetical protein